MAARFNIVSKTDKNITALYIVAPDGRAEPIAYLRFPTDGQLRDDMEAVDAIIPILRRRIGKSI